MKPTWITFLNISGLYILGMIEPNLVTSKIQCLKIKIIEGTRSKFKKYLQNISITYLLLAEIKEKTLECNIL